MAKPYQEDPSNGKGEMICAFIFINRESVGVNLKSQSFLDMDESVLLVFFPGYDPFVENSH
jgi:hypothetical protein